MRDLMIVFQVYRLNVREMAQPLAIDQPLYAGGERKGPTVTS